MASCQGQGFIPQATSHAFPLTNPHHTLLSWTILLACLTFITFLLHSASSVHDLNQVICIQEARQSPFSSLLLKSHSPPSHPHSLFLHRSSQGDMIHPCLTPLLILKHSLSPPFTLTQARLLKYIISIPFNSLPPISYILNTCHNASLLTLS